ncbi:NDR1/HIN1-like protein 1 [Malania oleifera]|uniref:NDR1/HIN1-like protein 1 n=1 Tax=Malania oleifera TaxID=397392 RepID=UPI0025AE560E|nr:NDR1/HIN1-like protein 1 [Malania oleifera]
MAMTMPRKIDIHLNPGPPGGFHSPIIHGQQFQHLPRARNYDPYNLECYHQRQSYRRLTAAVLAFVFLVLFIIFLVWIILRAAKPAFVLQDVTVFAFNVSGPAALTSIMQATVLSRNPNARVGVYYDKLVLYVSYRNQQVTLSAGLPATYQGHKDVVIWSPVVSGANLPVAPQVAQSLVQDQMTGTVLVNIKVGGRVRWKVGTWVSLRYRLRVSCPAFISWGSKSTGIVMGDAIKYQMASRCSVDV